MAARLKLPFVEGPGTGTPALHLLSADEPVELWRSIASDHASVWVVERTSFGEDPPLLLTLRARLPADRLSYVELPLVSWWEAREDQLAGLPFGAAAASYLASGGHEGFLSELHALASLDRPAEIQVPQRVRAAYLLEAQKLSPGARLALDKLSVAPTPFCPELLERVGAKPHLDELERLGWLSWDEGWRFADVAARTVLRASLQRGRRRRSEDEARALVRAAEEEMGEVHQQPAHTSLPRLTSGLGRLYPDWTSQLFGQGVMQDGNRFALTRFGDCDEPSGVSLELSEEPLLLHLYGRIYVPDALSIGPSVPLKLRSVDRGAAVYLEPLEPSAGAGRDGTLDYWFYVDRRGVLNVECDVAEALAEFELSVL